MDHKGFESRLLPYKPKLLRYAGNFLRNADDAQDVVQEVYAKLWSIRERLDSNSNLEALMMKITKHLSLNSIRGDENRKKKEVSVAQATDTPFDQLVFKDTRALIALLIEQLPEVQQELIHLKDKEGFSQDEIAVITGYDKNYIRVNLSRARKKLRSLYYQIMKNEDKG